MPLPPSVIPNALPSYQVALDDPTGTSTDPNAEAKADDINQLRSDVLALAGAVYPGGPLNGTVAANTAVNNHVAAGDPHPQYLTQARGDVRYAQLAATNPFPQYLAQGAADARYVLQTATDPFPAYLTQPRGDARYVQLSAADPFPIYFNQARGDARYVQAGQTHTRSIRAPILYPAGTFPLILPLWRVPYGVTVTAVYAYRVGGTGAAVNVRKVSGGTATVLLASDYSVLTAGSWQAAGALAAAPVPTLAAGDSLEAMFQSIAGNPTLVVIQIDYTEPVT